MKKLRIDIEIPRHLHKNVEQGVYYCSETIRGSAIDRETGEAIELELHSVGLALVRPHGGGDPVDARVRGVLGGASPLRAEALEVDGAMCVHRHGVEPCEEALAALDESTVLREAFGDAVIEHYLHTGHWEQSEYDRRVTDWELPRNFERV